MVDLARWLGQQLDEDERIARRASEYAEAEWRLDEDGETILWWPPEPRVAEKEREHGLPVVSDRWRGQTIGSGGERIAPHIAEWDPARVLREIDAKRQLVKLHGRATLRAGGGAQYYATTTVCRSCEPNLQFPEESWPCSTLRLLASVYADRPGFREEWAL